MCGIVAATGNDARQLVERVIDALQHRGPDSYGIEQHRDVVIGMTRLAVMDPLARSDQPMRRGRFTVVYNGELYNHDDIRGELRDAGVVFDTAGDTEPLSPGNSDSPPDAGDTPPNLDTP